MRKIRCSGCRQDLGEIRDAKLRKGMAFLCDSCERARTKAFETLAAMRQHKEPDFLRDLFKWAKD